jgi:hypothetical protein
MLKETKNKFCINKYLSEAFLIQNDMMKCHDFSPQHFNFILEPAIKNVQEHREQCELNVIHKLLVYADDVNILVENINTIQRKTEAAPTD